MNWFQRWRAKRDGWNVTRTKWKPKSGKDGPTTAEMSDFADEMDPDGLYIHNKENKMALLRLAHRYERIAMAHNGEMYLLQVGDQHYVGEDQTELIRHVCRELLEEI